jgi:putative transposase
MCSGATDEPKAESYIAKPRLAMSLAASASIRTQGVARTPLRPGREATRGIKQPASPVGDLVKQRVGDFEPLVPSEPGGSGLRATRLALTFWQGCLMRRRIYDDENFAHFVTFSCFHRRRLLDHDQAKQIIVETMDSQLVRQNGRCLGFVVMPDHVHGIIWFPKPGQLSLFMKQWKQRSSFRIKRFLREMIPNYSARFDIAEPVWQARYYAFNIYSEQKLLQKLNYMHSNPVKAGLVDAADEWKFSSARLYETENNVTLPW